MLSYEILPYEIINKIVEYLPLNDAINYRFHPYISLKVNHRILWSNISRSHLITNGYDLIKKNQKLYPKGVYSKYYGKSELRNMKKSYIRAIPYKKLPNFKNVIYYEIEKKYKKYYQC